MVDARAVDQLTVEQHLLLQQLDEDHKTVRLQYECDAFIILNHNDDHCYWQELFGFDRYDVPKGIPKINIGETA